MSRELENPENAANESGSSANLVVETSTLRNVAVVSSSNPTPQRYQGEYRTAGDLLRDIQAKEGMSITVVESNRNRTSLSHLAPEQILPAGNLTVYLSPSQMSGAIRA